MVRHEPSRRSSECRLVHSVKSPVILTSLAQDLRSRTERVLAPFAIRPAMRSSEPRLSAFAFFILGRVERLDSDARPEVRGLVRFERELEASHAVEFRVRS